MGAVGIVQARVGYRQVIQDFAPHDRLGHDPRDVPDLYPTVPDSLGIDDDRWTVLALIEATGVIGPRQATETRGIQLLLERRAQRLSAFWITTAAAMAGVANVAADEDMVRESSHDRSDR